MGQDFLDDADASRLSAIQNMIVRTEIIESAKALRRHPWSMIGGHPQLASALARGPRDMADLELRQICVRLGMEPIRTESIVLTNMDRFYSTIGDWIAGGANVVELADGVEQALRAKVTPAWSALSAEVLSRHPGLYIVNGFDERGWLRHILHHTMVHKLLADAGAFRGKSNFQLVLSRLSRLHILVRVDGEGLRFMVIGFDLIDMDWQVPVSTGRPLPGAWADAYQSGSISAPAQHPNPWFLSLIPEGSSPTESIYWSALAFDFFSPLLQVATAAVAASLSAVRAPAAGAAAPSKAGQGRRSARAGEGTHDAVRTRSVWLNVDDLSGFVRSAEERLAPSPPASPPPAPALDQASTRAAHLVREHTARFWVSAPAPDEAVVATRVRGEGVLHCVERPRKGHVRGSGDVQVVARVRKLRAAG